VLAPQGLLIVSSPNKTYYQESRAQTGPNPFHEHEFEPEEFQTELSAAFPCTLLLQIAWNRSRFIQHTHSGRPTRGSMEGWKCCRRAFPHRICAFEALPGLRSFVYVQKPPIFPARTRGNT